MHKHFILIVGLGVLLAGCNTPAPTATVMPTLRPVRVEVIAADTATPRPPTTTTSPTPRPNVPATLIPTVTPLPASVTPTRQPATPTSTAPVSTDTPGPTALPSATTAPTATLAASLGAAAVAPLPAGVSAQEVAAAEQHTIDLINAERTGQGLPPLKRDDTLMGIARARVADMVARHYTGHYDPVTGEGLGKAMMRAAGYTSGFMGENWYGHPKGPGEAADVAMNWFMSDPPHADNILSPNFVGVGVGLAFNGKEWLIVQNFAGASR